MNDTFTTDRWAKRAAQVDRLASLARQHFHMPPIVKCVRCGIRTSNVATYPRGPQCAEFFECSRRVDVRYQEIIAQLRNEAAASGSQLTDGDLVSVALSRIRGQS